MSEHPPAPAPARADNHQAHATKTLTETLQLADFRRRVADLYAEVRRRPSSEETWRWWIDQRNQLLRHHPQGPLANHPQRHTLPQFFAYNPGWRIEAELAPHPDAGGSSHTNPQGDIGFQPIGVAHFAHNGQPLQLDVFWMSGYAGGLFVPFRDTTSGSDTYGAGRYVVDSAKSAEVGAEGYGQDASSGTPPHLVLDFNYAYQPSCAWEPHWPCPLAPRRNHIEVAVDAGERYRPATDNHVA